MALKPTIFKFDASLADMDRDCYESLSLTVAQHPSETVERMMVRRRGPPARAVGGEPALDRLKKASRLSSDVVVLSFNSRADVWWRQLAEKLPTGTAWVFQLDWTLVQTLAGLIERTGELSVTINRPSIFVAAVGGEVELTLETLTEQR